MKHGLNSWLYLLLLILGSCMKAEHVDLVIHNANIHSLNENGEDYQAMAIRDGKIVELGPERQILNKYSSDKSIDLAGKHVYPGLTDAHFHLTMAAKQRLDLNLSEASSWSDVLLRIELHLEKNPQLKNRVIVGRGWNETTWGKQGIPTNEDLNSRFPETAIILYRYDGHTLLANQSAIDRLGLIDVLLDAEGQKAMENGLFTDNQMDLFSGLIPALNEQELEKSILELQDEILGLGITQIHDAGLIHADFKRLKKLDEQQKLKLDIHGMWVDEPKNRAWLVANGAYSGTSFYVKTFKCFLDGALGSNGALLSENYSDLPSKGNLVTSTEEMVDLADFCGKHNLQLATHVIGDGALDLVLEYQTPILKKYPQLIWRLEHLQVTRKEQIKSIAESGFIPSIQPTHLIDDASLLLPKLGKRLLDKEYVLYPCKAFIQNQGIILLGSDFPIASYDPVTTLKNALNHRLSILGVDYDESISEVEAVRGMTFYPAIAVGKQDAQGSLEKDKDATFSVFDKPFSNGYLTEPNYAHFVCKKGKILVDNL